MIRWRLVVAGVALALAARFVEYVWKGPPFAEYVRRCPPPTNAMGTPPPPD